MPRIAQSLLSELRQNPTTVSPTSNPSHRGSSKQGKKVYLRRPHKKSHLGCKNCKQRRIKCDETLPSCSQCKRSNLAQCSYLSYTPEQIQAHSEKRKLAETLQSTSTPGKNITMAKAKTKSGRKISNSAPLAGTSAREIDNHHFLDSSSAIDDSRQPIGFGHQPQPRKYSTPSEYVFSLGPPAPKTAYLPPDAKLSPSPSPPRDASSSPPPPLSPGVLPVPPVAADGSRQFTPPPTDKYCKYYLPPISGHWPIPKTPVSLPPLNKKASLLPSLTHVVPVENRRRRSSNNTITSPPSPITTPVSNSTTSNNNSNGNGGSKDLLQSVYSTWIANIIGVAYHYPCLYHVVMAFSYGHLYVHTKNPEYSVSADKHRFIALHEIQQEIMKLSPKNTDSLITTCLILSWDVFFQETRFEAYASMSRGLGAVLDKVEITTLTSHTSLYMTESLVKSMKSILYPPYPATTVLAEISSMVEDDALALTHAADPEYIFLTAFIRKVQLHLEAPPTCVSQRDGIPSRAVRDPVACYTLLKEWLCHFPASSLDDSDNLLHIYYVALNRVFEALMPEIRYLFQFSFSGPLENPTLTYAGTTAPPTGATAVTSDGRLAPSWNFPMRLLRYFRTRQNELNRLFLASSSALPVTEQYVESFLEDFDFEPFMPVITSACSNSENNDNDDTNTRASSNVYKKEDVGPDESAQPPLDAVLKNYFKDRMNIFNQPGTRSSSDD